MRIQIVSDLHLEARPKATFMELLDPGVAPILALLGDVAPLGHPNLRPFLEWCSEKWETVLWIPGCLELLDGPRAGPQYIPDLEAAVARMRAIAQPFWNVTVLDHEGMVSDDGVYIFGLPFWKFPRDSSSEGRGRGSMLRGITDVAHLWHPGLYKWVEAEPSPMHTDVMRRLYNEDIAWLRNKVAAQREPVVVLSHFGPTVWIQEEAFVGDPLFATTYPDVEELMKPPMVAWACGHCHQSVQFAKEWGMAGGAKGSVLITTNPKGLPFENLEYRPDAVLRIDPKLYSNI
jgi:hypothetical protein